MLVVPLAEQLTWSGTLAAIVPSAGAELLTDGGLENWTDATNLVSWAKNIAGTSTVNREATVIHGGTFAARFDIDGSNSLAQISQTLTHGVGTWYQGSAWARADSGTPVSACDVTTGTPVTFNFVLSATYAQFLFSFRGVSGGSITFKRGSGATSRLLYFDDLSLKALTLISLFSLRTFQQVNGVFTNHPTRALNTQAGIVHYANATNQVIAYLDGIGNVKLDKNVAGTWTQVASTAVTYSAGAALTLQRTGAPGKGFYNVTYNGAQVGTPQSVTDTVFDSAHQWGNFSTFSTNTFGAQSWTGPHTAVESYNERVQRVGGANLIWHVPLSDASGTVVQNVEASNKGVGTYVGGPTLGQTGIGDGLTATLFDGINDVVDLPAGTLTNLNGVGVFNPDEFTLLIWVKMTAANLANASQYYHFEVAADGNNKILLTKQEPDKLWWQLVAGGVSNAYVSFSVPGDAWFCTAISASKSLNKLRLYLNGVQQGSDAVYPAGTWAGALAASWTQIAAATSTNFVPATLAHAMIYNRLLTSPEVLSLSVP